jgi:stage II sporulation protein GA (sporulation sigma-E factor processing peptidase)
MKMTGVIYADVLFILNAYVTYAILLLTALFLRISPNRIRLLFASLIGGAASLLIICPWVNNVILGFLRLVLCAVLPMVAFNLEGIRQFFRKTAIFLTVNFIFAGMMFAIWYFISPTAVYYNTGIVYFDIDALNLVVITAVCYFAVKIFSFISDSRIPKNCLYDVCLEILGEEICLKGFLDTGNSLLDPFTGSDVIIVSRDSLYKFFPEKENMSSLITSSPIKLRYLPCTTVSGKQLMPVFICKKARIKGLTCDFSLRGVTVALSDEKIKNGDFQALLPPGIFSNNSYKGEDYEENTRFFAKRNF